MNWYIEFVKEYPIISAMIQFAILGTLGDMVSYWLITRKAQLPYKPFVLVLKMSEWAVLAVFIKYAFIGFNGFVDSLIEQNFLPQLSGLGKSFSISKIGRAHV